MNNIVSAMRISDIILSENEFLIIQDLDGVCIPLVQDPLKRKISSEYIHAASKLKGKFSVLTCGEHDGERGVNRLVEKSLNSKSQASKEGLYLPGLAACGVEYQDRFGNITHPGLNQKEIEFLSKVPNKMRELLQKELDNLGLNIDNNKMRELLDVAICDTRFTPTLNLNELFDLYKNQFNIIKNLQIIMKHVMEELINNAIEEDLFNSFNLHMMPNLGIKDGKEIIKYASKSDLGTTDIQFVINGAIKEAGLLVILNQYFLSKTGNAPFGNNFNVKTAPKSFQGLIDLCLDKIPPKDMPLLIGAGDTVTSSLDPSSGNWLRGGSDRQFLTLIQELGKVYNKPNQVIFVNSSNDEVRRPKIKSSKMDGVSDPNDLLKFNEVMENGPIEYINWFISLSSNFE